MGPGQFVTSAEAGVCSGWPSFLERSQSRPGYEALSTQFSFVIFLPGVRPQKNVFFFLASSTSCQSLACLLPSWHLLLTEPWHVLAFDELVLKVQVHLSFFLFCLKAGSEVREMKQIQPPKRKSI